MSLPTNFASRASLIYYLFILLGSLLSLHSSCKVNARVLPSGSSESPDIASLDEFSWDKLTPEKELIWQECFPGRQCARLIVPLNYSEPEGDEAIIAVIRKPSIVSVTSSDYLGPVLFNPGHSSGVDMIQGPRGDLFSVLLGPQFDIVSFDPRGIGHSTPNVSILSAPAERAMWEPSQVHNTDDAVAHPAWTAQLRLQIAEQRHLNHLIKIQANQTVQDILRIVEAHGRTKIQYWGFSYRSDLSAAFPSMFPDRIDRFVIYAIADPRMLYWGNNPMIANFYNTSQTMQSFYNTCRHKCRFRASSHDEIRGNLTNLMSKSIQSHPVLMQNDFPDPFAVNTSHPMLLVSSAASTVTRLQAASRRFPNSVILTQNSTGHGSVSPSPSLCTINHVRQYFINGKLPEPGTVCEVDTKEGLEEGAAKGRLIMHMSEEDKVTFNALKELSRLGLPFA